MWLHYSSDQKPLEIFHILKFFLLGKLKYIMESLYITCPHEVSHKETCLRKISLMRSMLISITFRQKTSFHPVDSTLLQKQIKIHIKHTPHKKITRFCINLIFILHSVWLTIKINFKWYICKSLTFSAPVYLLSILFPSK